MNIGVKNVITNYMSLEVNESVLLWHLNNNFVDCNNDDRYMNAIPGHTVVPE